MFGLEALNLNEFQKKQRIDLAMKFPKVCNWHIIIHIRIIYSIIKQQSLQVATEMIAILEMPTTEAKVN